MQRLAAAGEARPQRELRARADGAPHARRRRRLYAEGRAGSRARAHRLDVQSAERRVRLQSDDPRRRREDDSRAEVPGRPRRWRKASRCSTRRACAGRRRASSRRSWRAISCRDDPPKALVDRCADTFSKTDGDIRETVRCIVTSPEFFSRAAYRAKVKTPFEVVASALRAVNAQPDTTPRTAQVVARLGQPIFGRQTPDGWPDRGDAWMNTGAILNRINFGLSLAAGQVPGARAARIGRRTIRCARCRARSRWTAS